ncbi:MAG: hypothetical protein ACJASL_004787 [Paraglaciecola sp.]|jgi:hypothetical protein
MALLVSRGDRLVAKNGFEITFKAIFFNFHIGKVNLSSQLIL